MANKKYDGVIEAVHYAQNGQVDWVRAYLRRGVSWSDHVILSRQSLMDEIKAGKRMMIGRRVEYMAGTFDVSLPVQVVGSGEQAILSTTKDTVDRDCLEGAPVL